MVTSAVLADRLSISTGTSIRREVVRGARWSTTQTVVNRLSSLVVFVLLSRLLAPREFGVVAAAHVFVVLAAVLADVGLARTLVQRARLRAAHLDTALILCVTAGALLTGLLYVGSTPITSAMGVEGLAPVLQALAIVPLLSGLSLVPAQLLKRQLRFVALALRSTTATLVSGAAAVVCAVLGAGVWALVVQTVLYALLEMVLVWVAARWRPSLHVEREAARDLLGFGVRVLGIEILNVTSKRSDDFLIATVLGPVALGLYSVAYRLLRMVLDLLVVSLQRVAFPALSRLSDQPERLAQAYLFGVRAGTMLTVPAFSAVIVLADVLTSAVFGDRWQAAASVMAALGVGGIAQAALIPATGGMLAAGQASLALRWTAGNALLNVAAFAIAVQFGITAVAIAFSVRAWMVLPAGFVAVKRATGLSLRRQMGAIAPSLVAGVAMILCMESLRHFWPAGVTPDVVYMVAISGAGLMAFGLVLLATGRRGLLSTIAALKTRGSAAAPTK